MAEKISVEIGLEGGTEVQRQLEDIGKSGQKAFSDIQGAAEQINLTSAASEFQDLGNAGVDAFNQISQAARSATIFEGVLQGVKKVEGAFESLGTAATRLGARLTRSLGPLGVVARSFGPIGIAAGIAAGAFIKFGNDVAKTLSSLTADAAKLGLTAQQFDKLRQSLTQAGVAPDAILPGLQKLQEVLAQDFFPTDVITGLQNFIAQLERMPDGVQRTQLAMSRLGDALGAQVIAGLQTGTISANNFAAALGAAVPATQQQIIEAQKHQQAINQLSAAWERFKAEVAAPILTPVFDFLRGEIAKLSADIQRIIQEIRLVKAVWDLLTAPVDQQAAAAQKVVQLYNQLGTTAKQATQEGTQGFYSLDAILLKSNESATKLNETLNKMPRIKMPPMGIGASPGFAHGGLLGGRGTGRSDSNLAWVSRGEFIIRAAAVRKFGAAFFAALNAGWLPRFARGGMPGMPPILQAGKDLLDFFESITAGITDDIEQFAKAVESLETNLIHQRLELKIQQMEQALNRVGLQRAHGGLIGGDSMGRFALGGLVPRPAMAFAGGGSVGNMSNVTINFPGLPSVGGLRASTAVVEELQRAATMAQVRSGGRKPSRYS